MKTVNMSNTDKRQSLNKNKIRTSPKFGNVGKFESGVCIAYIVYNVQLVLLCAVHGAQCTVCSVQPVAWAYPLAASS